MLPDGRRRALWGSETPTPDPLAVIPPPEAFADFPDEGRIGSSGIERLPCRGGTIRADERSDEARPGREPEPAPGPGEAPEDEELTDEELRKISAGGIGRIGIRVGMR